MIADIKPSSYLTNYSNYNGDITIPLAAQGIDATEGDANVGDIRKIMHVILKEVFTAYTALPTASRPTKFSIVKSTPIGVNANTIRQSYTVTFDLDTSAVDLTTEL